MTTTDNALAIYEPPPREMTRLKAAFSKDLSTPDAIKEFATICRYYDLDPFIGEIVPMHGRIYVEEAGWLRHIQQKAPGQLVEYNAGICDKAERDLMSVKDGDWLAWGKVTRRYPNGATFPVRELATVTKDELSGSGDYKPVQKEPWRMAMKRARVRGLRIAFREVLNVLPVAEGEPPFVVDAAAEEAPPLVADAVPAPQTPTACPQGPTGGREMADPRKPEMACEHVTVARCKEMWAKAKALKADVVTCLCCEGPTSPSRERCKDCQPEQAEMLPEEAQPSE